jgi:hypothetical protein
MFEEDMFEEDYLINLFKNMNIKHNSNNKISANFVHSMKYLIDPNLKITHSQSIKLGNNLEKIIQKIILDNTSNIKSIKEKNKKGILEKDHLMIDEVNKIVYYAELKSNLYLDTEKCKSTTEKCLNICYELRNKYHDYTVKWCLVGNRYLSNKEIPSVIAKKYEKIKDNVYGINDYLELFNIKKKFTNESYKLLLNNIVKEMINQ